MAMRLTYEASRVLELHSGDGISTTEANQTPVIGFNLSGTLPPLICVQTWRDEVDNYRSLSAALGPDQPIYVASPPTARKKHDFPRRTEAWADFFEQALGPLLYQEELLLGGWSYGGVTALKIAERLDAEGRRPLLVNMFDTLMPIPKHRKNGPKRGKFQKLVARLHSGFQIQNPDDRKQYFRDQAKEQLRHRIVKSRGQLRSVGLRLKGEQPTIEIPEPEPSHEVDFLKIAVGASYVKARLEKSTLPVSLYWTQQTKNRCNDASLGWSSRMFGEFYCHPVGGDHVSMFEKQHIGSLAKSLREDLARVTSRLARRRPASVEKTRARGNSPDSPTTAGGYAKRA